MSIHEKTFRLKKEAQKKMHNSWISDLLLIQLKTKKDLGYTKSFFI